MISSWRSAFPGMWEILDLFSHKSESPGKRAGRRDVFRGSRSQSFACFGCMKSFSLSEAKMIGRLPSLDIRGKNKKSLKASQALEWVSQFSGVTIPGSVQEASGCGVWGHNLGVVMAELGPLKVSPNPEWFCESFWPIPRIFLFYFCFTSILLHYIYSISPNFYFILFPPSFMLLYFIYTVGVDVFVLRSTVQPPWTQIRNVPALHTSVPRRDKPQCGLQANILSF